MPDTGGVSVTVRFTRPLREGDQGTDVEAVKRALARAGYLSGLKYLAEKPLRQRRTFLPSTTQAVRTFQATNELPVDGVYGKATHLKLSDAFDRYAASLMRRWRPQDPTAARFDRLLTVMQRMTAQTPGYRLGSGHGVPLRTVRYDQPLDCSSSVSKALYDAELFPHEVAWVSGDFDRYGEPGKGRLFTVYSSPEHVWIRLHKTRWWRFDTSPHGDGGRGPRLRMLPRSSSGFTASHWKGM